jgi:D-3-phosphoglycerate dehydrogenase
VNKVVILDTGYNSYEYEKQLFKDSGYELHLYDGPPRTRKLQLEFAREAHGILIRHTRIDQEALEKMPRLKAIVRYGVGYDNVDVQVCSDRGVRVANVQGYANHAVSNHALALMFACIRDLGKASMDAFGKPPRKEMFEPYSKTLGIIGIGRIGSKFCQKASPLFHRTIACDPYKSDSYIAQQEAEKVSLQQVLEESHIISIHCNLTDETRHILNRESFRLMKHAPVIINTSRGPVIDETELLKALNKGVVHSAGLDVFEKEPPGEKQEQLLNHPHVISTPHIAWYSDESILELQKRAADNLVGLLTGKNVEDELT